MLYNLLFPLSDHWSVLNLFKYITFRSIGATLTALILALTIGPWMIRALQKLQSTGQPIRSDGPQRHILEKSGTPTMEKALSGSVPIYPVSTLSEAVQWADHLAKPGETVLLSPACTSFDMFRNFEERGERFQDAVHAL